MVESDRKDSSKLNTSIFWFLIVPISILVLLGFFLYIIYNINSIQTISSMKVFELVKKLKHNY